MSEYNPTQKAGHAVARLRAEAGVTQSTLAEKSGLDQSRISRIEKGEVASSADIDRVLDALEGLGVTSANNFKKYAEREWTQIEPPSFWNPERECLELTEDTLKEISNFLEAEERPWPLRRQIEKHRESLSRAANYLVRLNHNIAFIGDQGVGKSTGISFIFDLLVPPSATDKAINRPVLETGAGGTTFCEVHIKTGPEFGISLLPMNDAELRELVADFCAAKWVINTSEQRDQGETIGVSREAERAIRNMSGLVRKREMVDGKYVYNDPVIELVKSSGSEEEFRTRVLGLMRLEDRTRRELWYDSSTRKHPMEWVTETFKAVNNGRLSDVSLPMSIDLLIPNFSRNFGELEITIIDTKGVDDVAVREDLDNRLKDPRTKVVFCSRFNDAPGTSARMLLQHMQKTFSERFDTGKVSILALPRAEEARSMKDDMGEHALTDAEGYEFKRMQVTSELAADDLAGIPLIFYNFESDDVNTVQAELFGQINYMRKSVEDRLIDLCGAAQDIIKNHEKQALHAALEEVANRLNTFLKGNRRLGARERLAHVEAINTARDVRYASTLWAATRRNGEYSGLNFLHLVGVGAARDASLRSQSWFNGLDAFLKSLKADEDLALASRSIDQIATSASESKRAFQEAVVRGGIEVYRDPLSQAQVWSTCACEWGRGAKFKLRVADHLEQWFTEKTELKEILENVINSLWEKSVIAPLLQLAQENSTED
jgi:transcriptional regulator with XRE-family HTH domain